MSASKFFTGILTKNPDYGSDLPQEQIEITAQVECYADDDSGLPQGAIIKFPEIKQGDTVYYAASATMDSANNIIVGFSEVS